MLQTAAAGSSFPRLPPRWADQGYTGTLVRWAEQEHGWTVQVVYPADRQMKRYAPDVLAALGDGDGARARVPRDPQTLGGRADILLARPPTPPQQR